MPAIDHCFQCGHDHAALAADAPCPECDSTPMTDAEHGLFRPKA